MQLVPAVRERMLRIRFLTAMAVGSLVVEDLEGDPRHRDAAPYLVWEWLVVEALTREPENDAANWGVPGTVVARNAGEPIGCLATTYTFRPGLFDEQCLARFLETESELDHEDLAFLLERESRLGSVYAGVLVDHTQAGVAHSLRWDVLPVRIRAGKQHAKLSLLAWSRHIRIVAASANLTEPGYRTNHEVATTADLSPAEAEARHSIAPHACVQHPVLPRDLRLQPSHG